MSDNENDTNLHPRIQAFVNGELNSEEFPAFLKELRENCNLTQQSFAFYAGVNINTVRNAEAGVRKTKPETIGKLYNAARSLLGLDAPRDSPPEVGKESGFIDDPEMSSAKPRKSRQAYRHGRTGSSTGIVELKKIQNEDQFETTLIRLQSRQSNQTVQISCDQETIDEVLRESEMGKDIESLVADMEIFCDNLGKSGRTRSFKASEQIKQAREDLARRQELLPTFKKFNGRGYSLHVGLYYLTTSQTPSQSQTASQHKQVSVPYSATSPTQGIAALMTGDTSQGLSFPYSGSVTPNYLSTGNLGITAPSIAQSSGTLLINAPSPNIQSRERANETKIFVRLMIAPSETEISFKFRYNEDESKNVTIEALRQESKSLIGEELSIKVDESERGTQ